MKTGKIMAQAQVFQLPLKLECALSLTNEAGNRIALDAAMNVIKQAIEVDKFDVNKLDMTIGGYSLFHKAVMGGNPGIVEYFLNHGADTSIVSAHDSSCKDMLWAISDEAQKDEISQLLGLGHEGDAQ
jgi:Ankyrin repeat